VEILITVGFNSASALACYWSSIIAYNVSDSMRRALLGTAILYYLASAGYVFGLAGIGTFFLEAASVGLIVTSIRRGFTLYSLPNRTSA
jgi:hypothetical protein